MGGSKKETTSTGEESRDQMKTLAFVFVLMSASAFGQSSAKCVNLHYREAMLCTFADGSGTEASFDPYTVTDYTADKWTKHYTDLVKIDTDYLQAEASNLHRENDAAKLTKKACKAASYRWVRGDWMTGGYCTTSPKS
jgi:hypothetical protein